MSKFKKLMAAADTKVAVVELEAKRLVESRRLNGIAAKAKERYQAAVAPKLERAFRMRDVIADGNSWGKWAAAVDTEDVGGLEIDIEMLNLEIDVELL